MKIIIAGGSGFLGKELETYFRNKNHEVIIFTRNPKQQNEIFTKIYSLIANDS